MWSDLRFALRTFRKRPGFTAAVVLALALGIGANSAMFSVINGVLLRPLPFPRQERLVDIWDTNPKRNLPQLPAAPGNYYDWRTQNEVLSAMGAWQINIFNLGVSDSEPERYVGAIVDRGFFDTLGVTPMLGRVLTEEEQTPGRDGVLILSYGVWRQRFAGDPHILGRVVPMNGRARAIIGVMPEGFDYPAQASAMWAPINFDAAMNARRDLHRVRVIGRLRDGVELERARAGFQTISARLAQQYPDLNQDFGIAVVPMLEDLVGDVRPALRMLLGAVAFVLLIACANAANLLLAKAAGRQREIAIRNSLGAGRSRILRQMLTESLVLSLAGGLGGLGLAALAFRSLLALAPASVPRLAEVTLDWKAIVVTLSVSLCTGLLFGLAPAWQASRADLHSLLKEGSRGAGSRSRMRSALVVAQVAAALVLLAGAGLLIRSFHELQHVDAGFDPQHVITMRYAPAPFKYNGHDELQIQLARNALDKIAALPGVKTAAVASSLPLAGNPVYIMRFEGRPPVTPSQAPLTSYFAVTPGYLATMGMRLVRGRFLSEQDVAGSPRVVVVNQTLVDRYFPHEDPIGKRLEIAFSNPPAWREIVGVVADVRIAGLDQDTPVQTYVAYYQQPSFIGAPLLAVMARTTQDPGPLAGPMKSAILGVDRTQPVYEVQPMTEIVSQSISQRRFSLVLLAFFALSALFLACLGLYGVMSYVVVHWTPEIGIRMALGARRSQVLFLVERQGMMLVLAGVAIGAAGGSLLTRLMTSLLFHVKPGDPVTLIAGAAVLILVSLLSCYLPARRASRVDPLIALRYE